MATCNYEFREVNCEHATRYVSAPVVHHLESVTLIGPRKLCVRFVTGGIGAADVWFRFGPPMRGQSRLTSSNKFSLQGDISMSSNDDTQLVIAIFDHVDQADAAAKGLKGWDKANDDIKLGAIGVMHQDDKGKIKTKKYGQHNTGKGAKIGLLLGVLAAVFAPATLIGGAIYGAVGGGVLGSFSKKSLGMSDEALNQLKTELTNGK